MAPKYSFNWLTTASGVAFSDAAVKPRMSENRTVISRRSGRRAGRSAGSAISWSITSFETYRPNSRRICRFSRSSTKYRQATPPKSASAAAAVGTTAPIHTPLPTARGEPHQQAGDGERERRTPRARRAGASPRGRQRCPQQRRTRSRSSARARRMNVDERMLSASVAVKLDAGDAAVERRSSIGRRCRPRSFRRTRACRRTPTSARRGRVR